MSWLRISNKVVNLEGQFALQGFFRWLYAITLVDNEIEFKFTLSKIGDTYYKSNPDIYPIVDAYYKQLD